MTLVDCCVVFFFFFKQKTAYEMRISDWSSDVCSSDLRDRAPARNGHGLDQSESPPPPRHALRRTQAEWLWHRKWNGGHAGIYGSAKRLYSDDLSGRSSYLSVGRFDTGAMAGTRRKEA